MRWSAGKLIELKVTDPYDRLLKRIQLSKLFGHENDAEKRYMNSMMPDKVDDFNEEIKNWTNSNGLRRGRLNSYPTFFDQIGLEVINPHDRKTKAGTLPTYIESAPAGAKGIFSLLYVPFDLMGKPQNQIRDEVMTDLGMVCKVLREMMLTYGFSAKKGSGFGVIEEKIDGTFEMSAPTIYKDNKYSSFNQLEQLVERVIKEVMKNEK